ncbi:hypothetical protein ACU8DI_09540 [Psychroserpens sp. BH13MA-6]
MVGKFPDEIINNSLPFITRFIFSQSEQPTVRPFLKTIVSKFPNVRDMAMSTKKDEVIFSAQSVMGKIQL